MKFLSKLIHIINNMKWDHVIIIVLLPGVTNSMPSLHLVKVCIHSSKNLYEQEDKKNKCR